MPFSIPPVPVIVFPPRYELAITEPSDAHSIEGRYLTLQNGFRTTVQFNLEEIINEGEHINSRVENNCRSLLQNLPVWALEKIDEDNSHGTDYGTIYLSWKNSSEGKVGLEIGAENATYFLQLGNSLTKTNNVFNVLDPIQIKEFISSLRILFDKASEDELSDSPEIWASASSY